MFTDRRTAGQRLATALESHRSARPLVLGLPRGGVPVAAEVARSLRCDLDVLVIRKMGAPGNPEFAVGAVGESGAVVSDRRTLEQLGLNDAWVDRQVERLGREVADRVDRFRAGRPLPDVRDREVIVVDDGLATGSTAAAAVQVLRALGARRIVVAVPVGSVEAVQRLRGVADEVLCLDQPQWFHAVGAHYERFDQVTDDEVVRELATYRRAAPFDAEVSIPVTAHLSLPGHCYVPADAVGVVAFAHGSGSSRHSPRNQWVASALNAAGVGTLLFDLLTDDESIDRHNVFDIDLLAERLTCAKSWLRGFGRTAGLPIGFFGASTGAAAALVAAATDPLDVAAIVSRGGRPDLADHWLPQVKAPTMLIVGGHDEQVLELNQLAKSRMRCECQIAVVPGATHLFEEPGTLQRAAELATHWFTRWLPAARQAA